MSPFAATVRQCSRCFLSTAALFGPAVLVRAAEAAPAPSGTYSEKLELVSDASVADSLARQKNLNFSSVRIDGETTGMSLFALADPALLRSILANLCANAVEHTPAGGEVAVAIESAANRVTLKFANTTSGFEPTDVDRLFDRFWRREAARGGQHLGLGLSLARSFAEAMNWSLTARLDDGRRLVFTLSGPG